MMCPEALASMARAKKANFGWLGAVPAGLGLGQGRPP